MMIETTHYLIHRDNWGNCMLVRRHDMQIIAHRTTLREFFGEDYDLYKFSKQGL